jgi:tripartite-type tricarboxylate transporter receptor subunit TctC
MSPTLDRRRFGALTLGLLGGGIAARPTAAQQQDWPNRPVTLVVPWAAGGSTDAVTRILAARLTADLSRPFVVDNRTGANGTIGFASVARARPDGSTFLVGTVSTYAMAPHLYQLPYDNDRAFTGVGLVAAMPIFMVVPRNSPYRTLAEFIAAAKQPNHRMVYANSGAGSSTHLATELFLQRAGVEMPDVGYRGGAPAIQGLLAGEAAMIFQAASAMIPLMQSGDVRALAVTTKERSPLAPEVPTIAESGFPDYEVVEHVAILAPAGIPEAIVRRMNQASRAAMEAPETRERLTALAVLPDVRPPEEWAAYNAAENTKWREVIRTRNICVQ